MTTLPRKMKAVVYHQFGDPQVLRLQELPIPKIKKDEVLVQTKAVALNPVDCSLRRGKLRIVNIPSKRGRVPGSDFAGVVVETGSRTKKFKPGQNVYGFLPPLKGGASAEYLVVKEAQISFMPARLTFEEAAALPLAGLTALQALRDLARLKVGEVVFIHGASGGVGTLAIQIARNLGAEIYASSSKSKHSLIRSLGADQVMLHSKPAIVELSECFDVFFDIYGNMPYQKVKHLLFPRGRHITTLPSFQNFLMAFLCKLFSFKGSDVIIVKSIGKDLDTLSEWVNNGSIDPVIDRSMPLYEISKAHEYLESKKASGKIILTM
jgi:NADPH:quinone reductase-like Zn-dependent oxidoreductase